MRTGALIGGTIGLALVLLGATMDNECSEFCIPPVVVGGVLGVGTTLGGVVLGGIVGTMAAPEIWGEPQQVAAAGGPRRARLGVTLSLARR